VLDQRLVLPLLRLSVPPVVPIAPLLTNVCVPSPPRIVRLAPELAWIVPWLLPSWPNSIVSEVPGLTVIVPLLVSVLRNPVVLKPIVALEAAIVIPESIVRLSGAPDWPR